MDSEATAINRFLYELKRRKVIRVLIAYVIVGWALIEVSSELEDMLELPDWTDRVFLVLIGLGMFVVFFLAWVFDITPQGIERTPIENAETSSIGPVSPDVAMPASDSNDAVATVCVLPFDDLSPETSQKWLVDGIASEIHSALSRMHRIHVASRRSSFRFRGAENPIRDAAEALGVRYVLSGSLMSLDDRIRVIAELDDTSTGAQIWSERYERSVDDLLQVQSEIAEAIVGAFGVERQRVEIAGSYQSPTEDLNAWGTVQRARRYLLDHGQHSIDEALNLLNRAVDHDPTYAAAQAALGSVLIERVLNGYSDNVSDDRDRALEATGRALQLAPQDPFVLKQSGIVLSVCGQVVESIRSLRTCADLAPYDFGAPGYLGWPLASRGEADDLREIHTLMGRLIEVAPDHPGSGYWQYHKAVAFLCQEKLDDAWRCMRIALDKQPQVAWGWMQFASIAGATGNNEGAREASDKASKISAKMTPTHFAECILFMTANRAVASRRLDGLVAAGLLSQ